MRWVGKRTLSGGRLEIGRIWLTWRGWRLSTKTYRIGCVRVVSAGPLAIFIHASSKGHRS